MYWTEELFHVKKPIIAMCHLRALPGDPYYDKGNGMKAVVEQARAELRALQDGGVDRHLRHRRGRRDVFQ